MELSFFSQQWASLTTPQSFTEFSMTFGHLNSLFLFIETPTQLYGPVTYAVAKELHSAVVVLKFL